MTRRYFRLPQHQRPKAYDDWDWYEEQPKIAASTVYEPDDQSVFTGVYDAEGQPLYRSSVGTVGFRLTKAED